MQSLGHCVHDTVGLLVCIGPIEHWAPMQTISSHEMPGCMVFIHHMSPARFPMPKQARHGPLQLADALRAHLSGLAPHYLIEPMQLLALMSVIVHRHRIWESQRFQIAFDRDSKKALCNSDTVAGASRSDFKLHSSLSPKWIESKELRLR